MQYEDFSENERKAIDKFKNWIDQNVRKDLQNVGFRKTLTNKLIPFAIFNKSFCKINMKDEISSLIWIVMHGMIEAELNNITSYHQKLNIINFIKNHNWFIKIPDNFETFGATMVFDINYKCYFIEIIK